MLAERDGATNTAQGLILPGAGTGRGLQRNSPPEGFASDKLSPRSEPKPPLFACFCRHEGCSPPQSMERPRTHRLSPSTGGWHDAQLQSPQKHCFLHKKKQNGAGGAVKFTPAGHRSTAFFGVFFHPRPLRSARNPGSAAQGGVAKGRRCGTSPRSQPGSENGKFPSFLQVAAPGGGGLVVPGRHELARSQPRGTAGAAAAGGRAVVALVVL